MIVYLSDLLSSHGGLFLLNCNCDVDKLNTLPDFYYEFLLWSSELRDVVDCEGEYKYIVWNNREIKIDGKSVFNFINTFFQKVLSIPKTYCMKRQILTLLILLEEKGF